MAKCTHGSGLCSWSRPGPSCCPGLRVGGSLSSLQAEAAGLLQLLCRLHETHPAPLLVFVDSLMLLNLLQHWGKANFKPDSNDALHFDVIMPLLEALHQSHRLGGRATVALVAGPRPPHLSRAHQHRPRRKETRRWT
jgi:hypothetical protein